LKLGMNTRVMRDGVEVCSKTWLKYTNTKDLQGFGKAGWPPATNKAHLQGYTTRFIRKGSLWESTTSWQECCQACYAPPLPILSR
jgi:hypothetical protein